MSFSSSRPIHSQQRACSAVSRLSGFVSNIRAIISFPGIETLAQSSLWNFYFPFLNLRLISFISTSKGRYPPRRQYTVTPTDDHDICKGNFPKLERKRKGETISVSKTQLLAGRCSTLLTRSPSELTLRIISEVGFFGRWPSDTENSIQL
jgi:hypothetical protein